MPLRLTLLGGALLGDPRESAAAARLPADRRGCLLALLGIEGGWVDRDRLALLFWPESDESAAKAALRQLLVRVRRMRLEPALEATGDAVRWPVASDVAEFRRALAEGDAARAVALYRGPLLDGFAVHDVGGVDAWFEAERDRLHGAFHGATVRTTDAALAEGRFDAAAAALARLLDLDPLAEDVVGAYVRALYLGGRRDAALQAFDRFAARLDEELGLAPLEATAALVAAVRRGDALEVPGAPAAAAPSPASRPLHPSKLVGRDAERRALRAARGGVVVLAGEPGIGKTALLREAWPEALQCGGVEGLQRLPYHPLAALVRARPGLADGLGPYREDLARLVPEVAPGLVPAPLDPTAARGRLAEALARFVAAGAAPLVVDDLQWADAATLETLGYLAGRGLPVVGAYRSGEVGPALAEALVAWRGAGHLTEVPVGPIAPEGVQALIGDLMGRPEGPPAFAGQLHRRSGGNPMFVLETLKALFEAGVLRADAEGWHTDLDDVTRDYAELDVPPAVSDVIARRLAHLDERTVRVLEAVAVARAALDPAVLAHATGLSAHAVADAIDQALAAGFLSLTGDEATAGTASSATPAAERRPDRPRFRHDLLRQSLDLRIPPARRRALHALLAAAMANADGARGPVPGDAAEPGLIAEHWFGAGELGRARVAWLEQAAGLRARGLQTDAIAALDAAAARVPVGHDVAWLRAAQALAALESGRPDEAERFVDAADEASRGEAGERPLALRLKTTLARVAIHFHRGSVADAQALLDEVRPWANLVEDADLGFEFVLQSARAAKELLRFDEAIASMEPAVAQLRRRRPDLRLVQFVSSLAALYDDTDRAHAALPLHREALALAKALGSRYYQVEVSINLLFCTAGLGRYDEAAAWAEEALTLGAYDNVPVLRTNLAANYFQAGRFEDALRHYAQLADLDAQPHLQVIALARSAECHALLGRPEGAVEPLERALDRLPHTDFPVALGAAAIALLRFGDDAQVARLRSLVPDLDPGKLPPHQRERLAAALAARG